MTITDEFAELFGVWEVARPYIHMIVDEREMELIVRMKGQTMTVDQVADLLEIPPDQADDFLKRCYSRYIVNKTVKSGTRAYSPADFQARLDHFAKYENWDDIPRKSREAIDRRFLDAFIAKHRPSVEAKMQESRGNPLRLPFRQVQESRGNPLRLPFRQVQDLPLQVQDLPLPSDTVLLLSEAEEIIEAAADIVVQPCDCRRLGQNCNKPVETCILLGQTARDALDRGHGRRLTRQEAKELLRWTDKKGLMHTAEGDGAHAICNCCACDCYPFRAAQELGSKGAWPKSNYVAVYDRERCNLCGACVKRCHFDAFYHDDSLVEVDGKVKKNVLFSPEKCWGCGLCANTCPSEAVAMERLS